MSDLFGELANGFDRSPTELAALYLELVPDGDAAAKEAVSLIDGQARPRSKRGKSVDPA